MQYILWAFAIAVIAYISSKAYEGFPDKELSNEVFQSTLGIDLNIVTRPPSSLMNVTTNKYNFGRYNDPIFNPYFHELTSLQRAFQRKTWHFVSFSDGVRIVGVAVGNLGYIETGFIYICDISSGFTDKISVVLPGGFGAATVSKSSIQDSCSKFNSFTTSLAISICYNSTSRVYNVNASARMEKGSDIAIAVRLHRKEIVTDHSIPLDDDYEFAMVYPLGPHR
jgi:hypothetical protein